MGLARLQAPNYRWDLQENANVMKRKNIPKPRVKTYLFPVSGSRGQRTQEESQDAEGGQMGDILGTLGMTMNRAMLLKNVNNRHPFSWSERRKR